MKKEKADDRKPLKLSKETLRALQQPALQQVAGGASTTCVSICVICHL
jgi:hypothetical protein